jgi:drug/metabolite transporter (DMT)-like permease
MFNISLIESCVVDYDWQKRLSSGWMNALAGGVSIVFVQTCWTASLDYTSIVESILFMCSFPLLVVAYDVVTGKPVRGVMIAGTVLGFLGLVLVVLSSTTKDEGVKPNPILGDMIATVAGIMIISFIKNSSALQKTHGMTAI